MKRAALIALLAIAILGLGAPVTAHAHDGPVATVAVLDVALPTVTALQVNELTSLLVAVQADMNQYSNAIGGAERIERADFNGCGEPLSTGDNFAKVEQRSRDVPGAEHTRG